MKTRLANIMTAAARIRRSKGFGIHSPFAFNFVINVLRLSNRYRYYAYHTLPKGEARMIFRIANSFNPSTITEYGEPCPLDAFDARKSTLIPEDNPFVIVSNAALAPTKRLLDVAQSTGVIIVRGLQHSAAQKALWESVMACDRSGMSFSNNKIGIFVASPKLPRQHFSLWL